MELVGISKVSKQGQITLPIEARRDLSLSQRKVYVYETRESIIISQRILEQIGQGEAEYLLEESNQARLDAELKAEGEEFV